MNKLVASARDCYVEFHLDDESKVVVKISRRNPLRLGVSIPEKAVAFIFFDTVFATIRMGGQEVSVENKRAFPSFKYYYGRVCGLTEIERDDPPYFHNVLPCLKYDRIIKNRFGEPRPINETDIVINPP